MDATAGISKRLSLPSSVHSVMSNDDLLIEILIRLPVISILDFKIVSKHWLSIIINPSFTLRRSKSIVDPPSALVIKQYFSSKYDLLPLDIRIPAVKTAFPFCNDDDHERKFVILHACNGLLLCSTNWPMNYYVYNPTINQFKLLPPCYYSVCITGEKMAFDPAKSPHYKVICVGDIDRSLRIYTYSSETGNWSTSSRYPSSHNCFSRFGSEVYWNDAIYWYDNYKKCVFKLDVDSLNLSTIVLPVGILKDEGTIDRDHKLFESRGCLLLVCSVRVNDTHDTWLLKVYEMMDDARSEWSVKYIVKLDDVMMQIPTWKKSANLFSVMYIVVGEREEDSFLVIEVFGKVIQYKIVLKTPVMLFDMGLVPLDVTHLVERGVRPIFGCFPLIASFAGTYVQQRKRGVHPLAMEFC